MRGSFASTYPVGNGCPWFVSNRRPFASCVYPTFGVTLG